MKLIKRPFGYLVIVIWILFEICDWGMSGFALGSVLIISRLVLNLFKPNPFPLWAFPSSTF